MSDYHGQEYVEGQDAQGVPAGPGGSGEERLTDDGSIQERYASVVMIGNFGALCAQNQTLEFENITLAQARKLKWDYFGVCGAVMTCYDAQGTVRHEE